MGSSLPGQARLPRDYDDLLLTGRVHPFQGRKWPPGIPDYRVLWPFGQMAVFGQARPTDRRRRLPLQFFSGMMRQKLRQAWRNEWISIRALYADEVHVSSVSPEHGVLTT